MEQRTEVDGSFQIEASVAVEPLRATFHFFIWLLLPPCLWQNDSSTRMMLLKTLRMLPLDVLNNVAVFDLDKYQSLGEL